MNTRDASTWNNWSCTKKRYLAYSRYLCLTKRSTNVTETQSMPSTPSSDSGDKTFLEQAGPYDDFKRRNLTLERQVNVIARVPRKVYIMDQNFHRKFGTRSEMLEKHALSPTTLHQTKRKASPINSIYCGTDDDGSSFCDSVSSIACSSFSHVDKQEKRNRDVRKLSDKNAKFDAIEKWLQSLPKPVLKPGLGNLSKI